MLIEIDEQNNHWAAVQAGIELSYKHFNIKANVLRYTIVSLSSF